MKKRMLKSLYSENIIQEDQENRNVSTSFTSGFSEAIQLSAFY